MLTKEATHTKCHPSMLSECMVTKKPPSSTPLPQIAAVWNRSSAALLGRLYWPTAHISVVVSA